MQDQLLMAYVWQQTLRQRLLDRATWDEAGEGVISAAIAVLIMAFLGAGMWVAFNKTMKDSQKNVDTQIKCIGQDSGGC